MKASSDKIAPRPAVNKLRPLKKTDSSLAGPDWSNFQVLFEDPEWLTAYGKARIGALKKSKGQSRSKIS